MSADAQHTCRCGSPVGDWCLAALLGRRHRDMMSSTWAKIVLVFHLIMPAHRMYLPPSCAMLSFSVHLHVQYKLCAVRS
jgi:hypothetical protein